MDDIDISFPGGKRIHAQVGEYLIQTDQPARYGGEASAPAPFDLFLASLATCAGIFAWNFCDSRKLPTEGLALRMHCDEDEKGRMIQQILFTLTLPKDFPDRYRDGIVRAMELCTVKRHLQIAPEFRIEIEP
jgi:uncharacterized OsmC-like protein